MRILVNQLEALLPEIPFLARRPRSPYLRRPCRFFRKWINGFYKEERVVKGSEKGNGKRKFKRLREIEEELEGRNVTSVKEEEVDLILVAREGDGAYDKEVARVTARMSGEQLLGFMDSLDGEWYGRSEPTKLVDAAVFVKLLPIGWKIEIAFRHRDGPPSLYCRSYVSPTGLQFKSCMDAAVYLIDQSFIDVAVNFEVGEMRQINDGSHMLLKSKNEVTSSSTLLEANNNLLPGINGLYDVKIASCINCFSCGLAFDDMGGLKKHLVIVHKKTTRTFEFPKQTHTLEKAQMDLGERAVVGYNDPWLGEASSSVQKIAKVQGSVPRFKIRTNCVWCNIEFLYGPVDAETMADANDEFMCPKCREQLRGVFDRSLSKVIWTVS